MMRWLRQDLQINRKDWTIAYWHHPPYTKGSHDSDTAKGDDGHMTEMREKVLPVLEMGGVNLVLCGHSHLYERSFLVRGHFGKSNTLQPQMVKDGGDGRVEGTGPYRIPRDRGDHGVVYVNSGSAGHATKRRDLHGLTHPVMAVSLNVPGSFMLDILGSRLKGRFIDDHGIQRDWFTIEMEP
jgi:3',5'-cyclic AMP phosphodiesterase CpdA